MPAVAPRPSPPPPPPPARALRWPLAAAHTRRPGRSSGKTGASLGQGGEVSLACLDGLLCQQGVTHGQAVRRDDMLDRRQA
eukprot:scaffold37330_cov64-Phaeocystis_antarctica.AAC.4